MSHEHRAGRDLFGDANPGLAEYTDDVLFGQVWEREGLGKRDRSLITVAALVAGYRLNELPGHINRALDNGLTETELMEAITHLAFYCGWPNGVTATMLARDVLAKRAEGAQS